MNFNSSRRMRTPSPHEGLLHYHISSPQHTPLALNMGPFSHSHSHSLILAKGRVLSPESRHCSNFSFIPPLRPITEQVNFIQPVQGFDRFSRVEAPNLVLNKRIAQKTLSHSREIEFTSNEGERTCASDFESNAKVNKPDEDKETKERELQRKQREEIKQLKSSVHDALEKKRDSSRTSSFPSFTYSSENVDLISNNNKEKSQSRIMGEEKVIKLDVPLSNKDMNSGAAADTFRPFFDRNSKPENILLAGYSDGATTNRKLSFPENRRIFNKSNLTISSKDLADSKKIYTQASDVSEAKSELMRKFQKNLQTLTAENEKLQRLIHLTNPADSSRVETEHEQPLLTREMETCGPITEGEEAIRCLGCDCREENNMLRIQLEEARKILEIRDKEIMELKAFKSEFLNQSKSLQLITKSTQENRREVVLKLEKLERENKRLKESLINQEEMVKYLETELDAKTDEVKILLEELPRAIKARAEEAEGGQLAEIGELKNKVEILLETNNFLNQLVEEKCLAEKSPRESQDKSVMTEPSPEEKLFENVNSLKAMLAEALKARDEAMDILCKFERENKSLAESKSLLERELCCLKTEKETCNKENSCPEGETAKKPNLIQAKTKALENELYQAHITISDLELKLHKLLTEKQRDKAANAGKMVELEEKMNFLLSENSSMRDLLQEIQRVIALKSERGTGDVVKELLELIGDKRNSLAL